MSFDKLAKLLQQLDKAEAANQAEPDMFTVDNDDIATINIMPGIINRNIIISNLVWHG